MQERSGHGEADPSCDVQERGRCPLGADEGRERPVAQRRSQADHQRADEQELAGARQLIGAHEQETHPERNKVLNCLGSPYEPTVEITSRAKLGPGDVLVLCSDGFWSGVPEAALAQAFAQGPVAQQVPELVRRAVEANGRTADNTTVVALQWEGSSADDDVPNLITYQSALATHAKRDEQLRTIGALVAKLFA